MRRSQEAQDHETLETNTQAADNRRADLHRRARVDRIRNRYRSRTHLRYACPRVCPPNSLLVAGRHRPGVMGFASDHREYDPPPAETGREPLGSSSWNLPRIRKPRLPGRAGQTKLARLPRCRRPEMVTVPNLLAGVDVDPDCHQTILATQ
jgi:hypothetical protein